jgi:hypothetical protein
MNKPDEKHYIIVDSEGITWSGSSTLSAALQFAKDGETAYRKVFLDKSYDPKKKCRCGHLFSEHSEFDDHPCTGIREIIIDKRGGLKQCSCFSFREDK